MALKPDRREFFHDIEWNFDAAAERGGIASIKTAGSGGHPGQALNVAAYQADPSGAKPLGILLHDVVSYDTNRQHENFQKGGFVARVGQPITIDRGGRYTTSMVATGVTVAGGDTAYLAASGKLSNVQATGAPRIGTFITAKDADGYAKVQIELL